MSSTLSPLSPFRYSYLISNSFDTFSSIREIGSLYNKNYTANHCLLFVGVYDALVLDVFIKGNIYIHRSALLMLARMVSSLLSGTTRHI